MVWMAVVEVTEDNLLYPHLILVKLFLCMCFAFCPAFIKLSTRRKTFPLAISHFLYIPGILVSRKFVFLEIRRFLLSACVPTVAYDISSRCGM